MSESAVVLLSGGLDSATCAAIAAHEGYRVYALTIRYGQRHAAEIDAARRLAGHLKVEKHLIFDLDLRAWGGSALTADIGVPTHERVEEIGEGIPVTYVPARNTIFLSLALAWAEVMEARHIFIGVNALDYSGYPDCRPEFIEAFQNMANLATKLTAAGDADIRIHTPLIHMTKREIIQRGTVLGLDYGLTTSCYAPVDDRACGRCDSCLLRAKGFSEAGIPDPALADSGAS